jgi:rifampicin phosphotransferase
MPNYLTSPNAAYHCGGKADNLFVLQSLGFRVPAFVVIPWEVLRAADEAVLVKIALEICQYLQTDAPNTYGFAVRSSGIAEDGQEHSFAGQFDTFLHVFPAQLAEKIAEVRNSANNQRVKDYLKNKGMDEKGAGIAVLIQRMVSPDAAGVAFGAHPVSGNRQQQVISAVYGLGEGLVSGLLDADTFTLQNDGQIVEHLVQKTQRMTYNIAIGQGTILENIPQELQLKNSLQKPQIEEIGSILTQLENHYGTPQDVEFAIENESVILLQTRPITTFLQEKYPVFENEGEYIIWDNSNIIESYPGLTSPLTFTFIIKMYEAVYRQLSLLLGVKMEEIEAEKEVFANMLGLIEGRVFYNLLGWYKALAMLPGYSINAEFMEKMMGVKERFELKNLPKRGFWQERWRQVGMVRTMWKNWRALPQMRRDFNRDFDLVMKEYKLINFEEKNAWELMQLYLRYEQTLLKKWKAPLVNDFFAMIYFGILQKLTVKYQLDTEGNLHNNLLCGAKDIVSTDPIHRCLRLTESIRQLPEVRAIFMANSPEKVFDLYQKKAFPEDIQRQIEEYLEKWGNRCVGELKLETVTYKQNPASWLQIIQSYLRQDLKAQSNDIEMNMRRDAEQVVDEKLRFSPLKRWVFNYFLKNTRTLVSERENLRYARTRGYGTVREIFCSIGKRFKEANFIENEPDIFFLTLIEIFDHIKGTSVNGNLRDIIQYRKRQYEIWEKSQPPAERIATKGMVYVGNDFRLNRNPIEPITDSNMMRGLGCCPGIVRAKVRIVLDPREVEDLEGDILVTVSTDPGWVTLFPSAGGILVEKGSLLSHSAIVSREMGKPCVVGITGLLQRLKTGDWVEMNGATGVVKLN